MNHGDNKNSGFTLIELTLAMAFISMLLLAIALSIIQVGTIYNRGMMLKEVNMTSREITDDLTRSIRTNGEINLSTDYVQIVGGGIPIGGRLCLGTVSYAWNYGEAIQRVANGESFDITKKEWDNKPVHIAKIDDPLKEYCHKDPVSGALSKPNLIATADRSKTNELLKEGDRQLDLYQFNIITHSDAYDASIRQQLYTIQYSIGSGNYTALNPGRTACLAPDQPGSDIQYCTIEQFNVVVRVGSDGS